MPSMAFGPVDISLLGRQLATSALKGARMGGFGKGFTSFSEQFAFRAKQAAGPTLRERLLGPTTGKPFIYGTYALAGASVAGLGMLCYYGLGMSKGGLSAADKSALWPQYVRERLQHTYGYLAGSIALTAGAAVAATRSPLIMSLSTRGTLPAMLVSIALMIGTSYVAQSIPYENTAAKHLAWALHTGVMGAILAPLCLMGGPVALRAAWYTAGIVAGLSATAICAPSERFLNMAGPLAMGFGVVFVSSMGTFFFPPHSAMGASLASIVIYGGLILFSLFLLYDTQRVIKRAETLPDSRYQSFINEHGQRVQVQGALQAFDPINAQMSLYMDIINIFIRILFIMGGSQRRK